MLHFLIGLIVGLSIGIYLWTREKYLKRKAGAKIEKLKKKVTGKVKKI